MGGPWEELQDGVTVQGFVKTDPEEPDAGVLGDVHFDGDWTFLVKPGKGFEHLLTKPNGITNSNRLIECEVEPNDDVYERDDLDDTTATFHKHLSSLKDDGKTWVTVTGAWVIDHDHDEPTEIHPITSILVEHPPPRDNQSRLIDFLVLSDDSDNFPHAVVHSDENRLGRFEIPVPLGTKVEGRITITLNMSKATLKNFNIVPSASGRFSRFTGEVHSGSPSEGQGFFHAPIELPGFTLLTYLVSRGIDLKFSIRELMNRAHVSSVRDLFQRLDTGGLAHQ